MLLESGAARAKRPSFRRYLPLLAARAYANFPLDQPISTGMAFSGRTTMPDGVEGEAGCIWDDRCNSAMRLLAASRASARTSGLSLASRRACASVNFPRKAASTNPFAAGVFAVPGRMRHCIPAHGRGRTFPILTFPGSALHCRRLICYNHSIRLFAEILDGLDWSSWKRHYVLVAGQPPIHPRIMIGSWLERFSTA